MSPTTATNEMPGYCFDVIIAFLCNKPAPKCPDIIPNQNFPLFVTWKTDAGQSLRGCIGTFCRDLPLHDGLFEYAKTSAFSDTRFNPICMREIPLLSCSVSLLVKFEPARNYRDWTIGVHGIRIEYKQHGRRLNAVYLPEVALEQQWNHVETLNHLMRKGGFQGNVTETDRLNVAIERFQSEKAALTFDQYVQFKKNRGEQILLHREAICVK